MIGIIGKKLGMTQIFDEAGMQIPCTVVEATPNPVTKVVTPEREGFAAVELGYGAQRTARESKKGERTPKGRRANKAEIGHAAKAGLSAMTRGQAEEWAGRAIRFNAIAPQTVMAEVGPRLRGEPDVASLALYLASGQGRALSGCIFEADMR